MHLIYFFLFTYLCLKISLVLSIRTFFLNDVWFLVYKMISHFHKVLYQTKLSPLFEDIKFFLWRKCKCYVVHPPMLKSYLSYSKLARDIKITNGHLLDLFGVLVVAEWGRVDWNVHLYISVYRYLEGDTCSKWVENSFYQHWLLKRPMILQVCINEVSFAVYLWDDNELCCLSCHPDDLVESCLTSLFIAHCLSVCQCLVHFALVMICSWIIRSGIPLSFNGKILLSISAFPNSAGSPHPKYVSLDMVNTCLLSLSLSQIWLAALSKLCLPSAQTDVAHLYFSFSR